MKFDAAEPEHGLHQKARTSSAICCSNMLMPLHILALASSAFSSCPKYLQSISVSMLPRCACGVELEDCKRSFLELLIDAVD